ncbi:MAG: hypothetical protein ABW049_10570 [Spongiibacteraceae bacterium]
MKYRIPYDNRGTDHWQPTAANDRPYTGDHIARVLAENRGEIIDAIQNCSAFSRKQPHAEKTAVTDIARR